MTRRSIDLNADLGEGRGDDAVIMPLVSSCNIACGGHAGDEASIRQSLVLAAENGVAVGAHPSYPDKEHFGRRSISLSPEALRESLGGQLHLFGALAKEAKQATHHVKPHGALYHDLSRDDHLAEVFLTAAKEECPGAAIVGLAGSRFLTTCKSLGFKVISEGFADRRYLPDGSLVPREQPDAVIHEPREQARQAVKLANADAPPPVETICLHGDTPGAIDAAKLIRGALMQEGWTIEAG